LSYLGLPDDPSPEAIQSALKAKRKRMQGMQANPKYRKQALFLIKHFTRLNAALDDLDAYHKDLQERADAKNLPVLEVAIKGVLAGGGLSTDQETFLKTNAADLGLSNETFERVLTRLCHAAGLDRSSDGVHAANPKANSRLELLGDPLRQIKLRGYAPVTLKIEVRNGGTAPMPGRIWADQDWLDVQPGQLEPSHAEQTILVELLPRLMTGDRHQRGVITFKTEKGDQAQVIIEVQRLRSTATVLIGALIALFGVGGTGLSLAVLVAVFVTSGRFTQTPPPNTLTISVDPEADRVLLDGLEVGRGAYVVVEDPPVGDATISVTRARFKTATREVSIDKDVAKVVPIVLEPIKQLSFAPTAANEKGELDHEEVATVVAPRRKSLDRCVASRHTGAGDLEGNVRIHVGKDGRVSGLEVYGDVADDPTVRACLARQVTLFTFDELIRGEYATLSYDYKVQTRSRD
jgi:hypothetical protein